MTDINVVRADLAIVLGGLGYSPYPVLPGSPEVPAAVINSPSATEYHATAAGHCIVRIPITLLVSRADEESAQRALNTAISFNVDGSVISALEAATGRAWARLQVVSSSRFLPVSISDTTSLLGVDITVELLA